MYLLKEMKIEQLYLSFAVNNDAPPCLIRLIIGETVLREFEIQLATSEVSFWAYIDIKEYEGELLRIECSDINAHMSSAIFQSQHIPEKEELYHEKYRPQIHFTTKRGWIGAPTNFQYNAGKWQLFYEHNPFGNKGFNNLIGSAVSKDLIHWEESEQIYNMKKFQGLSNAKREEPYYIELPVDDKSNRKKWVCISSKGIYTIGHFIGDKYIPENSETAIWFGIYSAILECSEAPENRCIQIGLGQSRDNYEMPFYQQMLIPTELRLKTTPDGIMLHATPIQELQNLRVWKRDWMEVELSSNEVFSQSMDFRIAPDKWPDIRILPADGTYRDITSDMLEMILDLEISEAKVVEVKLCGITSMLNFEKKTISCLDIIAPLVCDEKTIKLQILFDKSSLEIFVGDGRVAMAVAIKQISDTHNIELFCHKGNATTTSIEIFGLRGIWPTKAEVKLIEESSKDNSVLYQSESYTICSKRIEDSIYGEPHAYVPDRNTILSPTRVVEEFIWRRSGWGDMIRVIDRDNVWHPNYQIANFPDIFTGHNTFDVACRLSLDIFHRCTSDEFARPGENGLWSAGQFQGPGEGFGVWVRDTAHVAIRMGNLLDPEGARRSLLYTTMGGFDNGVDGIGMPIVGICDYYLATGDLTLIKDTWYNLKGRLARLEERLDSNRGLIIAEQSTSNDAFPEPECGGFSLATEIYFMEAFHAMSKMGKYMEEDQRQVSKWEKMGDLLLNNIRKQYWKESAGFFTSGPIGSESYSSDLWESAGQEMAIWPRYGIASKEQRSKILEKLPEVAMNEFGVNVFPYRKETNHFCNAAWVVWTAGMAAAAGREGKLALLMQLIAQQVRNCVMNKTFYEAIDYNTGRAWRWPGQLWHAAGFLSYFYLGVLGLEYDEQGITFTPAVPELVANLRIDNFRYRKANLAIQVKGWGTKCITKLDGSIVDHIPSRIEGRHLIELFMD